MYEYIDAGLEAHWSGSLAEATGLAHPPFAPVVRTSGIAIYTSGQTYPIIGVSGQPPAADASLEEQTEACLVNIHNLVRAAGGTKDDIVKVTIYNTRMSDQAAVNAVYLRFFDDHRPTRTHVEVARLADPDLLIEIEATAVIDG